MDGSAKINKNFFLRSLPQVPGRVRAIQLFLALFRHMEMLIHMNQTSSNLSNNFLKEQDSVKQP